MAASAYFVTGDIDSMRTEMPRIAAGNLGFHGSFSAGADCLLIRSKSINRLSLIGYLKRVLELHSIIRVDL
jgi:hypothetical protein